MPVNVLLVSSESDCEPVKDSLGALGHEVTCAKTPPTAFKTASRNRPGLVIVDLIFRHRALKLIRTLCDGRFRPAVLAIAVPGHPDIARSALLLGVADILTRPINLAHLAAAAANAVELAQLSPDPVPGVPEGVERVFGDSEIMQSILGTVQLVAPLDCTILLVGEVGTGRDSVAEAIHVLGSRSPRSFVTIDCAARDPDRLERDLLAQLSGSARGRKRGARSPRPPSRAGMTPNGEIPPEALRARTSEGTLYLQQVDRLAPHLQDVLMHVVEANHSLVDGPRSPSALCVGPEGGPARLEVDQLGPIERHRPRSISSEHERLKRGAVHAACEVPVDHGAIEPLVALEGQHGREVGGASFERELRRGQLRQPGRVGQRGGRVVGEPKERAAHRPTAGTWVRELELNTGIGFDVRLREARSASGRQDQEHSDHRRNW